MSSKLEPAIWSGDTSWWIHCFDRCQLTRTWKSNVKEEQYKPRLHVCQPINWSMAATLGNSTIVVMRTCPRAIPPAMIIMRKSIDGFPFLSYTSTLLDSPLGCQSSATNTQTMLIKIWKPFILMRHFWIMQVRWRHPVLIPIDPNWTGVLVILI